MPSITCRKLTRGRPPRDEGGGYLGNADKTHTQKLSDIRQLEPQNSLRTTKPSMNQTKLSHPSCYVARRSLVLG